MLYRRSWEIGIQPIVPLYWVHCFVNQFIKRKFNKLSNLGVVRISAKIFLCIYASHQNLGSFFLSLCPCTYVSFCWKFLFPFTKEPNFPPLRPSTMPAPHLSIRITGSGYDPVELNYLVFNCSIIRWLITTTFSVLLKKNSLICSHLSKLIPRATAGAVYSSRLANQISDGEGLAPNVVDGPPLHRC